MHVFCDVGLEGLSP